MKRFSILFASTIFVGLAAAACGGSDKPAPQEPAAEAAPPAGEEHGKLTPELDAFHEALAPRWHADKGEARTKDTCGAVADFQAKAAAVKAAPAPAGVDGSAWTDAGAELESAVSGLATACGTNDPAAFETAFEQVHHAFHKAMELVAPPMGPEHADHAAPPPAPSTQEPAGTP